MWDNWILLDANEDLNCPRRDPPGIGNAGNPTRSLSNGRVGDGSKYILVAN